MGCTKGGKSKMFTMNVNHNGKQVALCPQFNRRGWFATDFNDKFMHNLIEYIKLQEKYRKLQYKQYNNTRWRRKESTALFL